MPKSDSDQIIKIKNLVNKRYTLQKKYTDKFVAHIKAIKARLQLTCYAYQEYAEKQVPEIRNAIKEMFADNPFTSIIDIK